VDPTAGMPEWISRPFRRYNFSIIFGRKWGDRLPAESASTIFFIFCQMIAEVREQVATKRFFGFLFEIRSWGANKMSLSVF
jgi:hypothetical protein